MLRYKHWLSWAPASTYPESRGTGGNRHNPEIRTLGSKEHDTPGEKDFQAWNIILACFVFEIPVLKSFGKGLDNGQIARDVNGSELLTGFWGHRKNLRSFESEYSLLWTNRPKIHEKPSCKRSPLPVLFPCKKISCVTLVDGCWSGCGSTGVFLFRR